jgi:hypothetical protein
LHGVNIAGNSSYAYGGWRNGARTAEERAGEETAWRRTRWLRAALAPRISALRMARSWTGVCQEQGRRPLNSSAAWMIAHWIVAFLLHFACCSRDHALRMVNLRASPARCFRACTPYAALPYLAYFVARVNAAHQHNIMRGLVLGAGADRMSWASRKRVWFYRGMAALTNAKHRVKKGEQ